MCQRSNKMSTTQTLGGCLAYICWAYLDYLYRRHHNTTDVPGQLKEYNDLHLQFIVIDFVETTRTEIDQKELSPTCPMHHLQGVKNQVIFLRFFLFDYRRSSHNTYASSFVFNRFRVKLIFEYQWSPRHSNPTRTWPVHFRVYNIMQKKIVSKLVSILAQKHFIESCSSYCRCDYQEKSYRRVDEISYHCTTYS